MLLFVLKFLAIYAFIYLVGGISLRASLAVAILFFCLWFYTKQNAESIHAVYNRGAMPYSIKIYPNIYKMLGDLGLVTTEWKKPEKPSSYPWTSLHTLFYALDGVVLIRDGVSTELVHWCGPNIYTKEIEYSENLDFLKFPNPALSEDDNFDWSPEFFFRRGHDGYEVGIRVLDSWYKENKERLEKTGIIKSIDDCDEVDGGRTRIILAVLSRKVFFLFNAKGRAASEKAMEKWRKKICKEIKEESLLAGWEIKAPWSPWGQEKINFDNDVRYVNKYAQVWLRNLD
jgi:hypothetical protein